MRLRLEDIPKKYHSILDDIWKCHTNEELKLYLTILPRKKIKIALTLLEMIRLQVLDNDFDVSSNSLMFGKYETELDKIIKKGKKDGSSS